MTNFVRSVTLHEPRWIIPAKRARIVIHFVHTSLMHYRPQPMFSFHYYHHKNESIGSSPSSSTSTDSQRRRSSFTSSGRSGSPNRYRSIMRNNSWRESDTESDYQDVQSLPPVSTAWLPESQDEGYHSDLEYFSSVDSCPSPSPPQYNPLQTIHTEASFEYSPEYDDNSTHTQQANPHSTTTTHHHHTPTPKRLTTDASLSLANLTADTPNADDGLPSRENNPFRGHVDLEQELHQLRMYADRQNLDYERLLPMVASEPRRERHYASWIPEPRVPSLTLPSPGFWVEG